MLLSSSDPTLVSALSSVASGRMGCKSVLFGVAFQRPPIFPVDRNEMVLRRRGT